MGKNRISVTAFREGEGALVFSKGEIKHKIIAYLKSHKNDLHTGARFIIKDYDIRIDEMILKHRIKHKNTNVEVDYKRKDIETKIVKPEPKLIERYDDFKIKLEQIRIEPLVAENKLIELYSICLRDHININFKIERMVYSTGCDLVIELQIPDIDLLYHVPIRKFNIYSKATPIHAMQTMRAYENCLVTGNDMFLSFQSIWKGYSNFKSEKTDSIELYTISKETVLPALTEAKKIKELRNEIDDLQSKYQAISQLQNSLQIQIYSNNDNYNSLVEKMNSNIESYRSNEVEELKRRINELESKMTTNDSFTLQNIQKRLDNLSSYNSSFNDDY